MNATMLLGGLALIAIGVVPGDFTRRVREMRIGPMRTRGAGPAASASPEQTTDSAPLIADTPKPVPVAVSAPESAKTKPVPAPFKQQGANVNFLRSIVGKKPTQPKDQGPIGAPLDPPDDPYGDDVSPRPIVSIPVASRPVDVRPRELQTQQQSPAPIERESVDVSIEQEPSAAPTSSVPFRLATTLTRAPFEPPVRRTANPDTTHMPSWLREAVEEMPVAQVSAREISTIDENDDAPLDSATIFGSATASAEERALWEQELADEASARDTAEATEGAVQAPPDFVAQHSFAVRIIEPEVVALPQILEPTVDHPILEVDDTELTTTWEWIQFLGDDVQTLGAAERENLIRMIAEMHDDDMLPVLVKAFGEEKADGLRLEVLKAIMTFDHPIVAELVVYVREHGTEAERLFVAGAAPT